MRKLLITGGSGNLGRPLSALAARTWETTATYYCNPRIGGGTPVRLDMHDREAVIGLVEQISPDVIIHTAASDRSHDMTIINRLAARHICEAARRTGARLIAISTDMVFDGSHPPYDEYDPPAPLSPYGRVKAENERFLLASYERCLIVRTSLIYDFTPDNRQVSWMLDRIRAGETVPLFVDEIRQPIWAWNLAEILLELAAGDLKGILNAAGPRPLSRWDYGSALLRALGYDPEKVARPVYAAEIAPGRPRDCTLRLDRVRQACKTPLLSLSEAVELARQRKQL